MVCDVVLEEAASNGVIGAEDVPEDVEGPPSPVRGDADAPGWTPEELAEVAHIDEQGFVSCPVAPYDELPLKGIGKYTEWPETKPRDQRSCAMRCFCMGGA